jgi:NAD(P)-dependent dehydrogenase (short-subunit alcohol dehydrogenase family)
LPKPFAVQLVQRLRDQDPKVTPALEWLDRRLEAQRTTADEIVHEEHLRQGAMNVTVRNVITSMRLMRLISATDWAELFESVAEPSTDGSTTVYFGPTRPAGVKRGNWILTMPDKGWFLILRLYSHIIYRRQHEIEFSRAFTRLDIVVSNAASGVLKPALEMTLKHWRWCLETNALALNLLAQGAAALMPADGWCAAWPSNWGRAGFGSTRSAPRWSIPMRWRPSRNGRRCSRSFPSAPRWAPALLPAHVADTVFLLCLPEAAMITGQTLVVDGGFSIRG